MTRSVLAKPPQAPHAVEVNVWVAECGHLVGFDLIGRGGRILAEVHLDLTIAEEVWRHLGEAIVLARGRSKS